MSSRFSSLSAIWRALLAVLPPLLLVVLFLRIVWGMWDYRDLTSGDTSSYYRLALDFSRHFTGSIAWSPLYTSYLGAWHWLNPDPYFVVIAHRIGILAILTVLIYRISRRLLTPALAWLVTAWWLVLPIDYDALYEVHLFAVIPVAIFWLLLAWRPSLVVRGWCVGLLFVTTVLMRNELLIALGIFGALSVGYDLWQIRAGREPFRPLRYLLAYGVPLIVAVLLIGVTYWRSVDKYPGLSRSMKIKHTLNVSQIYAFGYGQRHPEYPDDPWVGYGPLMMRDFGRELPTMREAFQANPRAMTEHFLWNAALIPSGLQVALFNCRSGSGNPDYADTDRNPPLALALSAGYLGIVVVGGILVIRHRRYWWEAWGREHAWVVVGLLAICATVAVVMIMQRPRPSYMFTQTLTLMWLAGFCLQVILHHLRVGTRFESIAVVPMLAVTFLTPREFAPPSPPPPPPRGIDVAGRRAWRKQARQLTPPRPARVLLMEYQLLARSREARASSGGALAAATYPFELTSYLDLFGRPPESRVIDTMPIVAALGPDATLDAELKKRNVRAVVIPFHQQNEPAVAAFMQQAEANGWTLTESRLERGHPYRLYEIKPSAP